MQAENNSLKSDTGTIMTPVKLVTYPEDKGWNEHNLPVPNTFLSIYGLFVGVEDQIIHNKKYKTLIIVICSMDYMSKDGKLNFNTSGMITLLII
jgi:hypothetical protein